MRIVLLPSAFAPYVGGVEVLTDSLGRSLLDAGHEVEVWTGRSPQDGLLEDERIDGLRVRRFVFEAPRASLSAAALWPIRATRTLARMNRAVREFRPDLLHVQCFGVNGVYASLLSGVRRLPLVVTLQGETFMDDHEIYRESLFLRTAFRLGLRRAQVVTGCSQFAVDDAIRRFGFDGAKTRVIYNGIDLEPVETAVKSLPFERFVFALGRMVPRKGFDLLIDAWRQIAERHQGTGLVLAGRGPDLARLRSLVEQAGLDDRVCFLGSLSRAEVAATMRAAEVFVMPSRIEAFGIVALEAWRAGTPAIVTSIGGAREFMDDGLTGIVVDPNDTARFAQAIDRLLTDENLRRRLTLAAAARLGAFSSQEIRRQYEETYEAATYRAA